MINKENILSRIEERCNETLCLNTAQVNKEIIGEVKNNINDIQSCFATIQKWGEEWNNVENVIHTVTISIKGKKDVQVGGKIITLSGHFFTHSMNLIPYKGNFILCDSWENMHYMNCRRTRTFSYTDIYNFLSTILRSTETGEIDDKDIINNFLNDDTYSNWENDYLRIIEEGEIAIRYDKDTITRMPDMYNLIPKLTFSTYEL
jgi:head-tail adaptor